MNLMTPGGPGSPVCCQGAGAGRGFGWEPGQDGSTASVSGWDSELSWRDKASLPVASVLGVRTHDNTGCSVLHRSSWGAHGEPRKQRHWCQDPRRPSWKRLVLSIVCHLRPESRAKREVWGDRSKYSCKKGRKSTDQP